MKNSANNIWIRAILCAVLFELPNLSTQGQDVILGPCNLDNNTAPSPSCTVNPVNNQIQLGPSISWITGTSHCSANPFDCEDCMDGTGPCTLHTEPVTWSTQDVTVGNEFENSEDGGTTIVPGPPPPGNCVFSICYTIDYSGIIYEVDTPTIGADNPTSTTAAQCLAVKLYDF